ncbi:N-methylhydantoinase A [Humitalea rosea]|uniref:N-methylhydantoinase A n=1 Tax=Humitalea rosea TaxID=990373 RepID=A0A2W7IHZ9_9PROT|nr:hydantoinase/oxoprolinase family protein [Humitalea rosea]PZW44755.1 N-methylhydantoinase A [Humitalea rosea]
MSIAAAYDIACDVGGSFVDVVAHAPGRAPLLLKRAHPPGMALPSLIAALLGEMGIAAAEVARLRLSTTLATNALASGTASPVALVTTQGFCDVPELGRQSRRNPDALYPPPPTPPWLAPRGWRIEVAGRIGPKGEEAVPLGTVALDRLSRLPQGAAVAICLLFSPLNPLHELAVAEAIAIARPDLRLSLSHRVDPGLREFERMLATLADAALKPLLAEALAGFDTAPWVLRAEGAVAPLAEALAQPLGLAMSGPAAGVLAVAAWAEGDAIGLDMGGTTTEISLVRSGRPLPAREIGIGDLRLRCPSLDIESLPLGGGTTLRLEGGRIRLGPAARPACCGGDTATLTDAALAAGWLPETLSGLALDVAAARAALHAVFGTADGLPALALAEASIAEQARRIALRRGIDPVRAVLVAGGGAGPLHAAAIAARMGTRRVLVPPAPGLLSATGLAMAPAGAGLEQPCDLPLDAIAELLAPAATQAAALTQKLATWGIAAEARHVLEMAYAGQSETLPIPWRPGEAIETLAARFDAEHAARRGHAPGGARRILALRSLARAVLGPSPGRLPVTVAAARPGALPRHALNAPAAGPLLLDGIDATIRVPPGWMATPRADGALLLEAVG